MGGIVGLVVADDDVARRSCGLQQATALILAYILAYGPFIRTKQVRAGRRACVLFVVGHTMAQERWDMGLCDVAFRRGCGGASHKNAALCVLSCYSFDFRTATARPYMYMCRRTGGTVDLD